MTETLEAPIDLEEGAAEEPANAPKKQKKALKATQSRVTVSNGSSKGTKAVKASGSRATSPGAAKARAKRNGSVPLVEEPEEFEAPYDPSSAPPVSAGELAVTDATDLEEIEPDEDEVFSEEETKGRRVPGFAAIRSRVRGNLVASGLAVALVVAVVVLILTQLSLSNQSSVNGARSSALAAARTYAVDLASYNYKSLNADFGKVLNESTPTFKQSFSHSSDALKTTLVRYDASAQATVVAVGLVSATNTRAVALVALNQKVNNTLQKNKPTTESRVEITLSWSNGRWLIDQVSLL